MRRIVLAIVLLLSLSPLAAASRPNIIVMMTDDQRSDAMSCAGNPVLQTPNMDRLAREGMRFRNMFVTNALCAPSRATLLTGRYSHAHGVVDNKARQISPDQPLLSDLLRENGYEVGFFGKSHLAGALRDRQWDYYFGYKGQGNYLKPVIALGADGKDEPYEGYIDDVVTGKAVEWIEREREKPFCLFLFFKASHRPWTRAPRHKDLYTGVTLKRPDTWDDDLKGKPRAFVEADNKIGNAPDVASLDFIKDYYATLVAVDENIGRVLGALEKTQQLDHTALLFTSDNGFFHGEWQRYDKRFMHEPSIRVPLLVRYPRLIRPGSLNDRMVLNIDIAPTVLDLAGCSVPDWMHGRSALPLLAGKSPRWRKDWLYEYFEYPAEHSVRKHRGVRTERYKLIHYFEPPEEFELYDLLKDPEERHNLAADPRHAGRVRSLQRRIEELVKAASPPTGVRVQGSGGQ